MMYWNLRAPLQDGALKLGNDANVSLRPLSFDLYYILTVSAINKLIILEKTIAVN